MCWSATVKKGSCSSGGVWHTTKWDSTGYFSSPPSTSSSLHGLLFIHRRPPPASICDCSSTGSCSSSRHRALLHRLLFNQPSPRAPVQPPLHGLLFIQSSTLYYSSSPPWGHPVHPVLHGVLFIQPSTGSCSSTVLIDRGTVHLEAMTSTTMGSCSSKPPPGTIRPTPTTYVSTHSTNPHVHCSSRGSRYDRLQLAAVAKESLDQVQLTAIDRSLGFNNV